mgnify:CR=1 FL=1
MRITKLDVMKIYKALPKRFQFIDHLPAYENIPYEQKYKLMLQGIYIALLALTDDPMETFWMCEEIEKSDDIFSTFFDREV